MIDSTVLAAVAARVATAPPALDDTLLQRQLRDEFGLRIVVCQDDDIAPNHTPAHAGAACRLYYLYTGSHCVSLTAEAAAADGLVVGRCGDDDDT